MMRQKESLFDSAVNQLKHGSPILIFDDAKREGETDLVFPSQFVTSQSIKMLRRDAGGLICTTLRKKEADSIQLPYLEELYERFLPYGKRATDTSDMGYDKHSSFTFTINHFQAGNQFPPGIFRKNKFFATFFCCLVCCNYNHQVVPQCLGLG